MRVLIIGEDPLARAGLARLLADLDGIAESAPDDALSSTFKAQSPDAVLWDLGWNLESSQWQERLADLVDLGAKVLALTPDRSLSLEAWTAGARGLLGREASRDHLMRALQSVSSGLIVIDPEIGFELLPSEAEGGQLELEHLTNRELEVLNLIAEGLSNRSIAHRLEISEHTVKFHVNAILRKLGAQSRTEAVVRATRAGLILL